MSKITNNSNPINANNEEKVSQEVALKKIENQVSQWLDNVVIGLNFCPFASSPRRNNTIHFQTSFAKTPQALLSDLYDALVQLEKTPANVIETTLLIVPDLLGDFRDYNDFLDIADGLIIDNKWEGVFQIASFHPNYCFENTSPSSVENLTNQSPYPILHLLRETSLSAKLDSLSSPDEIYKRNIKKTHALTPAQINSLFPYLK